MSAYTPGFVKDISGSLDRNTAQTAIAIIDNPEITLEEPMMAASEVITTLSGDIVTDIARVHTISISTVYGNIQQEDVIALDDTVVNIDGTIATIPAGEVIVAGAITIPQTLDYRVISAIGNDAVVVFVKQRAWNTPLDPAAIYTVYDSMTSGVGLTKQYEGDIAFSANATAGAYMASRASDLSYITLNRDLPRTDLNPVVRIVKGILGSAPTLTNVIWKLPVLPVCLGCNGTHYIIIAEGNGVYYSTDGLTWVLRGTVSPALPSVFSSSEVGINFNTIYGALGNNYSSAIYLRWIPAVGIWKLGIAGGIDLKITSDPYAQTGWHNLALPVGIYPESYHADIDAPVASVGTALFMCGVKRVVDIDILGVRIYNCIYKSADNGETWQVSYMQTEWYDTRSYRPGSFMMHNLVCIAGVLIAVAEDITSTVRSTDSGATWEVLPNNAVSFRSKNSVVTSTKICYTDTSTGWYTSSDGLLFTRSTLS